MPRKKTARVPKELKTTWPKDYYDLTEAERSKLRDFYIRHLQACEMAGGSMTQLDPPHFMTQEDILKKEEEVKMDLDGDRKKVEEATKKAEEERQLVEEWESKRILKLEEVERLRLENLQLKLELVEKTLKEANAKKKDVSDAQIKFAEKIEERLGVKLDDYRIDLLSGLMVRDPSVQPPKK